jgi:putative transposase
MAQRGQMKHQFTYKYRLYPTEQQQILLAKHFGHTRFLYNEFLRNRIDAYKDKQKTLNYYDNQNSIPELKKTYLWLKEVGSQSLQYAARCLQNGFDNFFNKYKLKKQGKFKGKCGFPRFKKRHGKQSFHVPQNVKVVDGKIFIPKFKEGISLILHRPLAGEIEFATISKNKAGQYFVSITCAKEIEELPQIIKVVGLDLNVQYIVSSDNERYANPLPATTTHKVRERFLARAVSRKVQGSSRRQKSKLALNKVKLKQSNVREDFLHKTSKRIIDENQVIIIEDLSVKSMLKNKDPERRKQPRWREKLLHRKLNDCCFSSFVQKLMYKAKWYGRQVIKIDRWFPSSQLCSECGWRNEELGEERHWTCFNCFTLHDRDYNASKNILNEGLRMMNLWNAGDSQVSSNVRPAKLAGSQVSLKTLNG